ncbi:MAG: hypothetical protein ACXQTD_08215 [Candidatus Syntropharchaeia archaeon]
MTEKCISCGLTPNEIIREYGKDAVENGYHLEDGFLCAPCAEYDLSEAPLVVYHGREEYPRRIGHYISDYWLDGEMAPFSFEWVPVDSWRGRYRVVPREGLVEVFSDSILHGHESEVMLKALDDIVMEVFDREGVDYYRVFSRTSNLFCTCFGIYVERDREQFGREVVEAVKRYVNYDDPVFSTGILFPRDEPAEFTLGNERAVEECGVSEDIKKMVIEAGRKVLRK